LTEKFIAELSLAYKFARHAVQLSAEETDMPSVPTTNMTVSCCRNVDNLQMQSQTAPY